MRLEIIAYQKQQQLTQEVSFIKKKKIFALISKKKQKKNTRKIAFDFNVNGNGIEMTLVARIISKITLKFNQ